ncbi:hypothetical protein BDR26DRAFT_343631 [Obelidium mucronatum]|nr:hypothetical protein BDR26DRAFT_343631 [Obelidium mucronatum]
MVFIFRSAFTFAVVAVAAYGARCVITENGVNVGFGNCPPNPPPGVLPPPQPSTESTTTTTTTVVAGLENHANAITETLTSSAPHLTLPVTVVLPLIVFLWMI